MKKLLKLGRNNQVAGISTRNTRSDVVPEGTIDITDIEVPEDIKRNPQNWTFENGAFREFTEQEKSNNDFTDEVYWSRLRGERNTLLNASDWTQSPDSPLSDEQKQLWRTYRAALRSLPETTTDPRHPTWPAKP